MTVVRRLGKDRSSGKKSIRFDLSPAPSDVPTAMRAGLLDRFRIWFQQSPPDRRSLPRHKTHGYQIWLGWWRGDEAFFANPARLVDISRGGALLKVLDPPPEGFAAWVCVGSPDPRDCVESTVLEVRSTRGRECAVRIAFKEPCTHAFFEAAVCSLARAKSRTAARPPSDEQD
jgi:hypothetical protein